MQNVLEKNEQELEKLKLDLVARKVVKNLNEKHCINDKYIEYLDDCLNLTFPDDFSYKDLVLVITTNKLPENNTLDSKDIECITLNGIAKKSDIVILEPLEEQMNNTRKLDVTNIKLKNNIPLSSKAIILVRNNIELPKNINYNIIQYKGDLRIALIKTLILDGYRPQDIKENAFYNQTNNKKLQTYLTANYPNKLSIDEVEILKARQQKELSLRYEILSIIRETDILVLDDIEISAYELVILAEHYKSIYSKEDDNLDIIEFSDFINIYGIRLNSDGIYLLDDDSLLKDGYANSNTINKLYNIYLRTKKNYKERINIINKRKSFLKTIYNEDVELTSKRDLSNDELDKLYKTYITINPSNSVKVFMQDLGIRINDGNVYLLNDNETIDLRNFVEEDDEKLIANILRKYNEDCYIESDNELNLRLRGFTSTHLSFDGLEDLFTK